MRPFRVAKVIWGEPAAEATMQAAMRVIQVTRVPAAMLPATGMPVVRAVAAPAAPLSIIVVRAAAALVAPVVRPATVALMVTIQRMADRPVILQAQ